MTDHDEADLETIAALIAEGYTSGQFTGSNGKRIVWDIKADVDADKVPDYAEAGAIAEKCGLVWGGNWQTFKDYPHLELPS